VKNFWFDASEPESLAGDDHVVDGVRFHNPIGQPIGSTMQLGTNEQVTSQGFVHVPSLVLAYSLAARDILLS
jgi:hypothetical protein